MTHILALWFLHKKWMTKDKGVFLVVVATLGNHCIFWKLLTIFFFWHCLFASCNFYLFSTYVLRGELDVFHHVNFSVDITVSLLHHWKTEPWQGHDNFERGKGNHFTFWKNIKQSLSPPCSPQDAIFDLDQPKVTVVPPPVCHKNVCQLLHWRANARLSLPL